MFFKNLQLILDFYFNFIMNTKFYCGDQWVKFKTRQEELKYFLYLVNLKFSCKSYYSRGYYFGNFSQSILLLLIVICLTKVSIILCDCFEQRFVKESFYHVVGCTLEKNLSFQINSLVYKKHIFFPQNFIASQIIGNSCQPC